MRVEGVLSTSAVVLVVASGLLTGCTQDAADFSVGAVEGSLIPFFEDPLVCTCNLGLDGLIQFGCSPDSETERELGYSLTFYVAQPPLANLRERSLSDVQVTPVPIDAWPAGSGLGQSAVEIEVGSDTFDRGTGVETGVRFREVFVWVLDLPAQRVCDAYDETVCVSLEAGRVIDARFGCSEIIQ